MLLSRSMHFPRRFYTEIDYASNMPKAYIDRMNRNMPRKVYDNRFGAPPVIKWAIPPDDYQKMTTTTSDSVEVPAPRRPWQEDRIQKTIQRENDYKKAMFMNKFIGNGLRKTPAIPAKDWTILPGDLVEVMVGRDKGKRGHVMHILRDENAVYVEGLHTKLMDKIPEKMQKIYALNERQIYPMEQPLFVHRQEVMLIDSNDDEPCNAQWILNKEKTDYVRVSTRTGYEIPIPKAAYRNYEYKTPEEYIECKEKDTPANEVLKHTYQPKLCTFEQEIEDEMGLEKRETLEKLPTFWY